MVHVWCNKVFSGLNYRLLFLSEYRLTPWACLNEIQFSLFRWAVFLLRRQCSECDQASSDEADIAMETLPDGTKRSRRQIKGPIKFIPQEMSPEPKKHQVRGTVCVSTLDFLLFKSFVKIAAKVIPLQLLILIIENNVCSWPDLCHCKVTVGSTRWLVFTKCFWKIRQRYWIRKSVLKKVVLLVASAQIKKCIKTEKQQEPLWCASNH